MQEQLNNNNHVDLSKQFSIPIIQQSQHLNEEGFSSFTKEEQEQLIKYLKVLFR